MDSARIEDLKRRIQRDPASIAFAQLGEEYRRGRRFRDAIDTCRAGLRQHPGYLSARVTLGRALIEVGELDQADRELEEVLTLAPDNLAALRGLADVAQRLGHSAAALSYLRRAAALAPQDAELQRSLAALEASIGPPPPAVVQRAILESPVDPPAERDGPPSAPRAIFDDSRSRALRIVDTLERWHAAIVASRGARA